MVIREYQVLQEKAVRSNPETAVSHSLNNVPIFQGAQGSEGLAGTDGDDGKRGLPGPFGYPGPIGVDVRSRSHNLLIMTKTRSKASRRVEAGNK